MTSPALRFCSYNCRGWRSGSDFVHSILPRCDFCLIQEHWLLSEHLGSLNISDDFLSWGITGMDSCEFLQGRPFGGCGIFTANLLLMVSLESTVPPSAFVLFLLTYPTFLTTQSSHCFQSVYMPTDYNSPEATAAFLATLCHLDDFTQKSSNDNHLLHKFHAQSQSCQC